MDGVFFPGGDPGDNHPRARAPVPRRTSRSSSPSITRRRRSGCRCRASDGDEAEFVYAYHRPTRSPTGSAASSAGRAARPSRRPRKRLDPQYPIRHYPDITHNVRCQYPIPWWDPALAFTLGREAINPRPVQYADDPQRPRPVHGGLPLLLRRRPRRRQQGRLEPARLGPRDPRPRHPRRVRALLLRARASRRRRPTGCSRWRRTGPARCATTAASTPRSPSGRASRSRRPSSTGTGAGRCAWSAPSTTRTRGTG